MKPALAALAWILLQSCAGVTPPRCSVSNEWGLFRARTPAAAERLAAEVARIAPRLRSEIPGLSSRPLDARFVESLHLDGVSAGIAGIVTGSTIERRSMRWVELRETEGASEVRRTLVHELVHFWLGPDWATLPYFLEEGLADD